MKGIRKKYSESLKTKVAIATIKDDYRVAELASNLVLHHLSSLDGRNSF